MSKAQEIAQLYFELSNKSDFEEIMQLMTDTTTYSSQNTGLYVGVQDIIDMQKAFHSSFSSLNWRIKSTNEIKPGVVLFEYVFTSVKLSGEKLESSGLEYVTVQNGKIQHIEISNV